MTRRPSSPSGRRSGSASARGRSATTSVRGADTYYVAEMLPYPSGEPHMGHLKNYAVGDAVAHFQRRMGRRVLHPIGYDAFGLPAENHAIRSGEHPRESSASSIAAFQREFRSWGVSFDWSRELGDPRADATTAGRSGSSSSSTSAGWPTARGRRSTGARRTRRCWRTSRSSTAAASAAARRSRRASSSSGSSASPTTPTACSTTSRRSSGPRTSSDAAELDRALRGRRGHVRAPEMGVDYPVFTTRPDTLFGATFFVMAPEHPDVLRLAEGTEHEAGVREYVNHALTESHEDRGDVDREKTGVPLGRSVINPVNGERIPMWVADYVLMEYGTGAIMAVPGPRRARLSSSRRSSSLPIRRVIEGRTTSCLTRATARSSTPTRASTACPNREALEQIVDWLDDQGRGHRSINYRLRDWLLSRQRYWGCPIPIVHCERCGLVPVPEDQLPVELPDVATTRRRAARRWRRPRTGSTSTARAAAAPRGARPTRWTRSSTPPGTSCATATRATTRPRGTRRARALDAGRPVHRRRRARDPAPDVRALLRQGARGHGPARLPGAVPAPLHAGHDHPRRREDVQVEGQRDQPASATSSATAPTPRAATSSSSGRPTRTPTGPTRASRASTASSAAVAPRRRRGRASASPGRRWGRWRCPRATTSSCCARRTGRSTRSRTTWRAASPSTRRSRR